MIFRTPNGVTGGQGTPPAVSPNRKPWAGEPEQTVQRASLRGQSTQSEGLGQASSLALSPAISAPASTAFPSLLPGRRGGRGALFFQPRLEVAGQQAARHCCSVPGEKNGLFCAGDLEAGLVTRMAGCRGRARSLLGPRPGSRAHR